MAGVPDTCREELLGPSYVRYKRRKYVDVEVRHFCAAPHKDHLGFASLPGITITMIYSVWNEGLSRLQMSRLEGYLCFNTCNSASVRRVSCFLVHLLENPCDDVTHFLESRSEQYTSSCSAQPNMIMLMSHFCCRFHASIISSFRKEAQARDSDEWGSRRGHELYIQPMTLMKCGSME